MSWTKLAVCTGIGLALCAQEAARLADALRGETPMMADLSELCDRIGGRPTGSPAYNRAVAWGVKKFQEAGVDSVQKEAFRVPSLWLPVSASGSAVSPETFPLRLMAAPGTPGVNVVNATLSLKPVKGGVWLVRTKEMKTFDDLFGEFGRTPEMMGEGQDAGVAAILLESMQPRGLLSMHPVSLNGEPTTPPVVMVAREQGGRLARLAEKGEVRVTLNVVNRTGPAYMADNVVAEIRGREKPEEIVVIGAHLDSWNSGTGAEDDGVNCALVIDLARQMKKLGLRPSRTVRFILFGGEEQGMWGSSGYVHKHWNEMDQHVAMLTYDVGSGKTSGFFLNGREELRAPLDAALKAAGIDGLSHISGAIDGTDNFDFILAGVPNLVAMQDDRAYTPNYHAESDTFDQVNQEEAKRNAAIAAAVVWGLAESQERPAKRQSRQEVEDLLKGTQLVEQMRLFSQWEAWEKKKRP